MHTRACIAPPSCGTGKAPVYSPYSRLVRVARPSDAPDGSKGTSAGRMVPISSMVRPQSRQRSAASPVARGGGGGASRAGQHCPASRCRLECPLAQQWRRPRPTRARASSGLRDPPPRHSSGTPTVTWQRRHTRKWACSPCQFGWGALRRERRWILPRRRGPRRCPRLSSPMMLLSSAGQVGSGMWMSRRAAA